MKVRLVFILLLFNASLCSAQHEVLPLDEQGKFIYYEWVDAKGVLKNQLKERITSFFKKSLKELKFKKAEGDTVFMGEGKFIINKTVLVMSHPSGEILYRFQAEVKEGKYRFWLTDFNFISYQRDRYGNFTPVSTKGMPLEHNPGKLNAAQWKEYQVQTANFSIQFAKSFKDFMVGNLPNVAPVKEKSIVKKEW